MAKAKHGRVTLNGRFSPGSRVQLVKVSGPEVLRAQGGEVVDQQTVDDEGRLVFSKGVEVGDRFFAVGRKDGRPLEVRLTGKTVEEDEGLLAQSSVGYDPAPAPRGVVDPKSAPYGLRLAQEQVGDEVPQRSATPRGTAHPVDPDERGPYPSQEDERYSSGKVPQRSDTPLGMATPIHDRVTRQEETDGKVEQRSDTPLGVATPLPQGEAVDAVKGIESIEVKAAVGEPSQAEARGVADLESKAAERAAAEPKDAPEPGSPVEVAEEARDVLAGDRQAELERSVEAAKPEEKRAAEKRRR